MKKLFFLIGILFLGCAAQVPLKREQPLHRVVVVYFDFDMQTLEPEEYEGEARGLVPDLLNAYQAFKTMKEVMKSPKNSEYGILYDSLYAIFKTNVEKKLGLRLLPINTLKGNVHYGLFGYPKGNEKKVAQSGNYDAALHVDAHLSYPQRKSTSYNLIVKGKAVDKFKPKMTLHVKMVDSKGAVLWNQKVSVKSKEYIVLNRKFLFGFEREEKITGPTIPELYRRAVEKLVGK